MSAAEDTYNPLWPIGFSTAQEYLEKAEETLEKELDQNIASLHSALEVLPQRIQLCQEKLQEIKEQKKALAQIGRLKGRLHEG